MAYRQVTLDHAPEVTDTSRHWRRSALALTAATLATAVACGYNAHKTAEITPSPSTQVPAAAGGSASTRALTFGWGKRVQLSYDTFGKWNPKHPEPVYANNLKDSPPALLVVDDGRYNFPKDPDPNTDQPTGLYLHPIQEPGQAVAKVPDGTVLKAVAWTDKGQTVSDASGQPGSPIWEEVETKDAGFRAWVPWVNVGYTALSELRQLPYVPNP